MAKLTSSQQRFIAHWGEMGDRWGINRTVAQIHALLHISDDPLTAEEIAEALAVARSNVSTSIRELQTWGLVRTVPVLGERKQYFDSVKDVWEMFRIIAEQRKRREIDPTIDILQRCIADLGAGDSSYTRERLEELLQFFVTMNEVFAEVHQVPVSTVRKVLQARGAIRKLLSFTVKR